MFNPFQSTIIAYFFRRNACNCNIFFFKGFIYNGICPYCNVFCQSNITKNYCSYTYNNTVF